MPNSSLRYLARLLWPIFMRYCRSGTRQLLLNYSEHMEINRSSLSMTFTFWYGFVILPRSQLSYSDLHIHCMYLHVFGKHFGHFSVHALSLFFPWTSSQEATTPNLIKLMGNILMGEQVPTDYWGGGGLVFIGLKRFIWNSLHFFGGVVIF